MKELSLVRKPENEALLGMRVREEFGLIEVRPNTIVTVDGKPAVVYGKLEGDWSAMRSILRNIKFKKNRRMNMYLNKKELLGAGGVTDTVDMTFGFKPSNPVFGTPAGGCQFQTLYPGWYPYLIKLGQVLLEEYRQHNPAKLQHHESWVNANVSPHWRIPGTPYTQGIINDANALGYHFDRDNADEVWSCMAYFKNQVSGGNLIVPSLGAKFICEDQTYMFFDGQGLMHGVTPIVKDGPSAYRYSLVYYTRASMAGLGTYAEELTRMKDIEMRKHQNRLKGTTP